MQNVKWIMLCLLAAPALGAAEFRPESFGARSGFSPDDANHRFMQSEGFANWNLPWKWELGSSWDLRTQLGLSAGWISGQGQDAFIGTAGPALALSRRNLPLELVAGVSPTLLGRTEFGNKDYGNLFQFTSHVGARWTFGERFELGYRYQHMSNAGIGRHNPGLNLHMFSIAYRF